MGTVSVPLLPVGSITTTLVSESTGSGPLSTDPISASSWWCPGQLQTTIFTHPVNTATVPTSRTVRAIICLSDVFIVSFHVLCIVWLGPELPETTGTGSKVLALSKQVFWQMP